MGPKDRREREKDELRKKILSAVMEVIAEFGHENLTIREIARRIEYSPRTIYLYFENRDHLLREVSEEAFRMTLQQRSHKEMDKTIDPAVIMEKQIRSHIAMAFSKPNLYRAVVSTISQKGHIPQESEKRIFRETMTIIRRLSEMKNQTVLDDKIEIRTNILLGAVRTMTIFLLNQSAEFNQNENEKYISEFIRFSINGLG